MDIDAISLCLDIPPVLPSVLDNGDILYGG